MLPSCSLFRFTNIRRKIDVIAVRIAKSDGAVPPRVSDGRAFHRNTRRKQTFLFRVYVVDRKLQSAAIGVDRCFCVGVRDNDKSAAGGNFEAVWSAPPAGLAQYQRVKSAHCGGVWRRNIHTFQLHNIFSRPSNQRQKASAAGRRAHSSSLSTAVNASLGTCTVPSWRIFFLPSFCFSRSFFLRVMSPP